VATACSREASVVVQAPAEPTVSIVSAPVEPPASWEGASKADVEAIMASAQASEPIVVARDEQIILPTGEIWELRVRSGSSDRVTGACVENVGSTEICRGFDPNAHEVEVLVYGGAPVPVLTVRSASEFGSLDARLSDGTVLSARAVGTPAGFFAAIPFSADNLPVSAEAASVSAIQPIDLSASVGDRQAVIGAEG
jgi:hypothetical protein